MRFVFDENHPPVLARMLVPLAKDEPYTVTSVLDLDLRSTPDTELLAALRTTAERNVLVTGDRAMRKRKHERAAVAATGAIVVVGVPAWNQQSDLWERARMMLWWWPTIVRSAGAADAGTFLELPWRQGVRALGRWRA